MSGRICPACQKKVDATAAPESKADPEPQAAHGVATGATQREVDPALFAPPSRVADALERARMHAGNGSGVQNMLYGSLWCIGGLAVTAVTYQIAAEDGGGHYLLAWGAILFGAIQFLRGLGQWSRG
jgi:hypothetical protein